MLRMRAIGTVMMPASVPHVARPPLTRSFSATTRPDSPSAIGRVGRALFWLGGASLGAYYAGDSRAALYSHVVLPLLRQFTDAEESHVWAVWALKFGLHPRVDKDEREFVRFNGVIDLAHGGKRRVPRKRERARGFHNADARARATFDRDDFGLWRHAILRHQKARQCFGLTHGG